MFGTIPCTSVIARSSLNLLSGAQTRRAALIQVGAVLASMLVFSSVMSQIPIPALSAVLITVSMRMLNPTEPLSILKINKLEIIPFFATLITMLATDLVLGIVVGTAFSVGKSLLRSGVKLATLTQPSPRTLALSGVINFYSTFVIDELLRRLLFMQQENRQHTPIDNKFEQVLTVDFSKVIHIDVTGAQELTTALLTAVASDPSPIQIKNLNGKCQTAIIQCDHSGKISALLR